MKKQRGEGIRLTKMRWVYPFSSFIVVGAVMSFGLIATLFLHVDRNSAITMLGMLPLMTGIVWLGMYLVARGMEKRIRRLIDAIHAVAGGDLSVQLPEADSQEFRQVYREFNLMVRELSRTKTEMDGFVNEFAHEFKTPITSISGFAQYLCETGEGTESPERMEYLRVIDEQAGRLVRLSQNTLLLSKLEATQIVTNQETYDLGEQVRRCVILLLPQMEAKRISPEISEMDGLLFHGSREILEHAWINLLGNAVKYTPEGGRITVAGKKVGGELRIRISDTGVGMEKNVQEHIFEKFYQAKQSLTGGNGLGLVIAERAAALSGGRLQVSSVPGQGSTFEVVLPALA